MATDFNFLGHWDEWSDKQYNAERTVNLYLDIDKDGKKPVSAAIRPGYAQIATLPTGDIVRELSVQNDLLYAVSSDDIYRLDTALTATHINSELSLNTSNGFVGIASNANNQILFVDGADGYLYKNSDSTFAKIVATHFPANPSACAVLDGYFIVNKSGTNENYASSENDGTSWSIESSARRFDLTYKTDQVIAYQTFNGVLYVFGKRCAEVWSNVGASGAVPFRRNNSLSLEYGCAAVGSLDANHGMLAWLASTDEGRGAIMMTTGGRPQAISTKALDDVIHDYSVISDAIGYIYEIKGHVFYDITFPTAGKTWTYDFSNQGWAEKYELNNGRYIANCHAFYAGKHLLGQYNGRNLYELSSKHCTDNGKAIPWLRVSKHLSSPTYNRMQLSMFQIDMMVGRADENGVYASPELFYSVSRDGGVTYSQPKRRTYTQSGTYRARTKLYQRGIARNFTFKLEGFSKVPLRILGAAIDARELSL